jgi:hypothetical protein
MLKNTRRLAFVVMLMAGLPIAPFGTRERSDESTLRDRLFQPIRGRPLPRKSRVQQL